MVTGGQVFLTAYEGDARLVLSIDAATGQERWRRRLTPARPGSFHPENGPVTPSPATDGQSVFIFLPEIGLFSYGLEGQERWRTPLGPFASVQGLASSPILVAGKVALLVDTPPEAFVAAFDAATGRRVWRAERPPGVLGSYATPTVYAPAGEEPQVVVAGALELTGYRARDGERLFWARGTSAFPAGPPFVAGDSVFTAEPSGGASWPPFADPLNLFDKDKDGRITLEEAKSDPFWMRSLKGIDDNVGNRDGVVTVQEYASASGGPEDGGLVRTRLGGRGDVRKSHLLWRQEKGVPWLAGALLYDDLVYVVRNAIVSTFDARTGAPVGQERMREALGEYYASPVAGDGKVYFASHEGKVTVVRAGRDWRVMGTGDLGEPIRATPAIADGRLFVRTETTLYAFGRKRGG